MKIEHGFEPFVYPNHQQIRALSNLYGPRNPHVKVLAAGRKIFSVAEMRKAGCRVDARTRFLVAPEARQTVALHTAELGTNAIDWRARDVLSGQPVQLRSRNEFWGGGTDWCRAEFEADARRVYELWHDGQPTQYFTELQAQHEAALPSQQPAPAPRAGNVVVGNA
jgi:hypothetical protein